MIPETMKAVVLNGHGGLDMLANQNMPTPTPEIGEVLIVVGACGLNKTDINALQLGGSYSTSGCIAGQMAELDLPGRHGAERSWEDRNQCAEAVIGSDFSAGRPVKGARAVHAENSCWQYRCSAQKRPATPK